MLNVGVNLKNQVIGFLVKNAIRRIIVHVIVSAIRHAKLVNI